MRIVIALLLGTSTILAGCASPVSITPSAGEGQHITYRRGEPNVASRKTHTVALQVTSTVIQDGNIAEFGIGVHNPTTNELVFSTENVTASWKGSPLKVYSFEELVADENRRQSIARLGLALQAFGAGVSGSSRTYDSGTVSSTYRGYGTFGTGEGTYSGYRDTYEPAAAAGAQQAVGARITAFQAESKASIETLERTTLRKHTLAPNTAHGGLVRIQMPSPISGAERIVVVVTIPPDTHTFFIDLKPVEQR